ncbi:hypothetical protein [Streptomyces sp. G45]|uniref:hypothetical protein n=1 Tax=Streptomyces sp. G45 TaxID=3406627 RepID=UPI003C1D7B70
MNARHPADAELDEALALVNDTRRDTAESTPAAHPPHGTDRPDPPDPAPRPRAHPDADARPDSPRPPATPGAPPTTTTPTPAPTTHPEDAQPEDAHPEDAHPKGPHPKHPHNPHPHNPRPHPATPWPEARRVARRAGDAAAAGAARVAGARGTAPVALQRALGHVLAAPLTALTDLPSFDTSAMDGWAVAGPGPWAVRAGRVLAGQERPEPLGDGEAVRIATGARIPPDTTAVIRSEHARVDERDRLHAERDVVPGQDIRPRAQECRTGEALLPPGTLVTPAVLGLAAAAGYDALPVAARPTAEVLVLGDELLTEGLPRRGGSGTRSARCCRPGCARSART